MKTLPRLKNLKSVGFPAFPAKLQALHMTMIAIEHGMVILLGIVRNEYFSDEFLAAIPKTVT